MQFVLVAPCIPEAYEPFAAVRVLSMEDWARRRGQRYGNLLVDLEQSRPVDRLPDRSAAALADWHNAHPTIETPAPPSGACHPA